MGHCQIYNCIQLLCQLSNNLPCGFRRRQLLRENWARFRQVWRNRTRGKGEVYALIHASACTLAARGEHAGARPLATVPARGLVRSMPESGIMSRLAAPYERGLSVTMRFGVRPCFFSGLTSNRLATASRRIAIIEGGRRALSGDAARLSGAGGRGRC